MRLHLENEVAVVKTPTIILNNPVHSVGRKGSLNVNNAVTSVVTAVLLTLIRCLPFFNVTVNCWQFLMTAVCFPLFFGTTSLYVYVISIACSQLEKLKVAIMNINRDKDTDAEEDHENRRSQGVHHKSHDVFRHAQEQINDCIRHHQQILEYDKPNSS